MIFPGLTPEGERRDLSQQAVLAHTSARLMAVERACEGLLILPTCQHAKMDLVQTGQAVEDEKDALLEKVILGAAANFFLHKLAVYVATL